MLNISATTIKDNEHSLNYKYVVIVDAGSTGSRVHVYKYLKKNRQPLIEIDFKNEKYEKFKPGLSSFEPNENYGDISAYMEPLLDFARQWVPKKERPDTHIYLFATAGMRKVRENNEKVASTIMDYVYNKLSQSEFITERPWVRIIEGRDEGLWGWIAANYLNGEIQNAVKSKSPYAANLYGVLEMGGESLQISFLPPSDEITRIGTDLLTLVEIGGIKFPLFTHSYMGMGMEAAQSAYDEYLYNKKNSRTTPCYLTGDDSRKNGNLRGDGDFKRCFTDLFDSDLITSKNCKLQKQEQKSSVSDYLRCTPNDILIPAINNDISFYFIENFYYTANVLSIQDTPGSEFLNELKTHGTSYCELQKSQVLSSYPHIQDDEITKTCFCTAWLAVIIEKGFNLRQFNNYEVIRHISDVGIDWPLGYLVLSSAELRNYDNMQINYRNYFIFFIIISSILIFFILKGQNKTPDCCNKLNLYYRQGMHRATQYKLIKNSFSI